MDLSKVRKIDHNLDLVITNGDIRRLHNRETIVSAYFRDSKAGVDVYPLFFTRAINIHVGSFHQEDDRYFFYLKAKLSNGMVLEKTFWNYEVIPLMSFQELRKWKRPRRMSISLSIGVYEGGGSSNEWQSILTDIDDFTPVSGPGNFHSQGMEELLIKGFYSDVTFEFPTGKRLSAHRCILMSSSMYFRALFNGNFVDFNQNTIKINFNYEVMKLILSFLYTGRIDEKNVENWPDLYRVARFYDIDILAKHAELQMMANAPMEMEKIKRVIKFAIRFQSYKLKNYMIKLARKNQETKEIRRYRNRSALFWML